MVWLGNPPGSTTKRKSTKVERTPAGGREEKKRGKRKRAAPPARTTMGLLASGHFVCLGLIKMRRRIIRREGRGVSVERKRQNGQKKGWWRKRQNHTFITSDGMMSFCKWRYNFELN